MANHISAKTRIKRNEKAAAFNASYLNSVRTQVKKVEKAVAVGDKACAQVEFKAAESALADAGFTNVTFKEIDSSEAAGIVVSQNPSSSESTEYTKDTAITVYISKGASNDEPTMRPTEPSVTERPTENNQYPGMPSTNPSDSEPTTPRPPFMDSDETTTGDDITIF